VLSAAIHIAALAALLLWHFSPVPGDRDPAMTVVDLAEDPPPETPKPLPPPPEPQHEKAASGAPAPAGPKAEAAPVAAAIPVVVPTLPASILPATGTAASSGAATLGTGTGAGGAGNGTGGGGDGNGTGGRPRLAAEPQAIRGYFNKNDYPKALREAKPTGTTGAEVMVGVDGKPLSCRITDPSGIPLFDSETCRLLLKRFRFRPARDMSGKPIAAPWAMDVDWDYIDLNEE
jgi:protein TonB